LAYLREQITKGESSAQQPTDIKIHFFTNFVNWGAEQSSMDPTAASSSSSSFARKKNVLF